MRRPPASKPLELRRQISGSRKKVAAQGGDAAFSPVAMAAKPWSRAPSIGADGFHRLNLCGFSEEKGQRSPNRCEQVSSSAAGATDSSADTLDEKRPPAPRALACRKAPGAAPLRRDRELLDGRPDGKAIAPLHSSGGRGNVSSAAPRGRWRAGRAVRACRPRSSGRGPGLGGAGDGIGHLGPAAGDLAVKVLQGGNEHHQRGMQQRQSGISTIWWVLRPWNRTRAPDFVRLPAKFSPVCGDPGGEVTKALRSRPRSPERESAHRAHHLVFRLPSRRRNCPRRVAGRSHRSCGMRTGRG